MTDSELIAEITKTAIIPFLEQFVENGAWYDVDTVFKSWETVYFLFMKHRPELKEIETKRMKAEKNRREQELEEQLLRIQTELKSLGGN
jgi:hypothetical protein